jgi:hypothetical protein
LPSLQYTNTTIIIIIKVKTKSSTLSHESAAGSALLKEGTRYLVGNSRTSAAQRSVAKGRQVVTSKLLCPDG